MTSSQLLDEFEAAWEEMGPPDILDYALRLESAGGPPMLTELCQIDLERRWRTHLPGQSRSVTDDYVTLLGARLDRGSLVELICWEFHVRNHWGDFPGVQSMLNEWPALAEELRLPLQRTAAEICRPLVSVSGIGDKLTPFALDGPLQVGRQSPGEPDCFATTATPGGTKLIIASQMDPRVSRNQLLIRRATKSSVVVTNTSRNRAVALFNMGVIGVGNTDEYSVPIKIHLYDSLFLCIDPGRK